jgi:tetratricopeptide (TPR) repeat protein
MGRALELLGRKDQAVRYFKQAIEIDPKCGPAKQGIERLQPARIMDRYTGGAGKP